MSSNTVEVDLCVIGGGWSGIAAAIEATRAGCRVALIEAAPRLGGRARSLDLDLGFGPIRLDNGQHLLMGAYTETLELIEQLVPDPSSLFQRSSLELRDTAGITIRAAQLPAPWHLAIALLGATGLGITGRIACVRMLFQLKRDRWCVRDGETVAALLRRFAQPDRLIERLWRPLCVSALNTPLERACARTFAAVLRDTLGGPRDASDFLLPNGTLGDCLPDPAERWLRANNATILLRSAARRIDRHETHWITRLDDAQVRASAVVLAIPPSNGSRLLRTSSFVGSSGAWPGLERDLNSFEPLSIATTYLAWPRHRVASIPSWVMLVGSGSAATECRAGTQPASGEWVFDRGIHRDHRIAAVVASSLDTASGMTLAELERGSSQAVIDQLHLPAPAHAFTVLERRATFACVPSRPLIQQPEQGSFDHLWIAGDFTERDYPATLEAAVRSGRRAGKLAAQSVSALRSGN